MEENENYGELIQRRRDPNGEMRSTARFLLVLLAIMFCVTILFTQIFNGVVVIGDSMKNTLYDGDYLYMNVSYTRLERGDIIVIDTHEKTAAGIEKYLIKRLIGLPGDSLYAEDGKLYRKEAGKEDFTLLKENYLPEEWDRNNEIASKAHPLTLQENEIFFMGDNRNISEDSRGKYRNLTSEDVVGIVAPWSIACKGFLTALFNIFYDLWRVTNGRKNHHHVGQHLRFEPCALRGKSYLARAAQRHSGRYYLSRRRRYRAADDFRFRGKNGRSAENGRA